MTKLLLRMFVKNYDRAQDMAVRTRIGRLSGVVGILCNVLLFAGKLIMGLLTGSVSITADAMNNLSDAASSIVTFFGFKLAGKPADANHPYGHARYEYVSALAVAAIILVIGFELAKSSAEKIFHPVAVTFSLPAVVVLLVSMTVKLWLCLFNRRLGKYIDSKALMATAADSRNDILATAAVLVAGLAEAITHWRIDGYMGMAVAVFIFYSGIRQARETISLLLGEATTPEMRQKIVKQVEREPMVLGYHDLMVHDYGPGQRFASLHVEMDREQDPILCHEIIDRIERRCLRKYNIHLVIHYDPVVTDDARQDTLRTITEQALHAWDDRLMLHDFRVIQGREHVNIVFDVVLPDSLAGQENRIKETAERALTEGQPGMYHLHITFDRENI